MDVDQVEMIILRNGDPMHLDEKNGPEKSSLIWNQLDDVAESTFPKGATKDYPQEYTCEGVETAQGDGNWPHLADGCLA